MTTQRKPLTCSEIVNAAKLIEALGRGAKVTYADTSGNLISGTLRHFCAADNVSGYTSGDDIRDWGVRITTEKGWEVVITVPTLLDWIETHMIRMDAN